MEYEIPMNSSAALETWRTLSPFTQGYVEAAFFTLDEEEARRAGYDSPFHVPFDMLDRESLAEIMAECDAFAEANRAAIGSADEAGAGRDFWFTRNGHGVGFWCRPVDTYANAEALTVAAQAAGERALFIDDDGSVRQCLA